LPQIYDGLLLRRGQRGMERNLDQGATHYYYSETQKAGNYWH
jgi:hypothetical protein